MKHQRNTCQKIEIGPGCCYSTKIVITQFLSPSQFWFRYDDHDLTDAFLETLSFKLEKYFKENEKVIVDDSEIETYKVKIEVSSLFILFKE